MTGIAERDSAPFDHRFDPSRDMRMHRRPKPRPIVTTIDAIVKAGPEVDSLTTHFGPVHSGSPHCRGGRQRSRGRQDEFDGRGYD